MTGPAIDVDAAARFLASLAEAEPVTFQTFDDSDDKRSSLAHWMHGDFEACAPKLTALNRSGAGIFWMVNYGDGQGRKAANVTGIRALFLDLDGAPLQPVLSAGLEPHAVVESSPGKWHVYWLVSGCALDQFKPAQQALAAMFGGDKSVHDLPRVLRLPGFLHRKSEPFATRLVNLEPLQPYHFDDLVQRLGLNLARPTTAEPRASAGGIGGKVAAGGRHEHLRRKLADLNWRGIPEAGIRAALHQINASECDPPKTGAEVDALVSDWLHRYASQHGIDAGTQQDGRAIAAELVPFDRVSVANVLNAPPPAPLYWWQDLVPAGHVTLLGAHGGTGKSMLALMLACALVAGLPLFGIPTRRACVAYFSAEDPASVMRHRVHLICHALGLDPAQLEDELHILDATQGDPALFREVSAAGSRHGVSTSTCMALGAYMADHGIDVLIVDNASDTYDASEIDRARVRAFMRMLSQLARPDRGVLLLAHVDKGTSRGDRTGTEGYSGSTAWHNSARSRLYLSRDRDGALLLEHQKHNLGPLHEPLRLLWPAGGIPALDAPVEGFVQHIADDNDTRALLKLLHEFQGRGEFVAASQYSPANAARIMAGERGYPKRKPADIFGLLRDAERQGLIERQAYRTGDRKDRERWALTGKGCALIGAPAPTAPTAPTYEVCAVPKAGAGGAPTAPTCGAGGVGGLARAQMQAEAG